MNDFVNNYYGSNTILCPMSLLLKFNTTSKIEVITYILDNMDTYCTIFDMEVIRALKDSMINPLIVEDNYTTFNGILSNVAKSYIEVVKTKMYDEDNNILDRIKNLNYEPKDKVIFDLIIYKLKVNKVLKEFLPQLLENNNIDLKEYIVNNKLTNISVNDVDNVNKELAVLKVVMANIYYLVDNTAQLDIRFNEKETDINNLFRSLSSKITELDLTDCPIENFITVYDKFMYINTSIPSTIADIQNIKQSDMFNINEIYLTTLGKLENGSISTTDMYAYEKAQDVKTIEQKSYNNLIDLVQVDISNINTLLGDFITLLKKIDL